MEDALKPNDIQTMQKDIKQLRKGIFSPKIVVQAPPRAIEKNPTPQKETIISAPKKEPVPPSYKQTAEPQPTSPKPTLPKPPAAKPQEVIVKKIEQAPTIKNNNLPPSIKAPINVQPNKKEEKLVPETLSADTGTKAPNSERKTFMDDIEKWANSN